jgi:hypothetical protein
MHVSHYWFTIISFTGLFVAAYVLAGQIPIHLLKLEKRLDCIDNENPGDGYTLSLKLLINFFWLPLLAVFLPISVWIKLKLALGTYLSARWRGYLDATS